MEVLAAIILSIHLAWILWVIVGAFWTRGRPLLAAFHLLSIVWGIIAETSPLPCPLTLAEQFFETKAGTDAYHGSFLVHYLDTIVYPDLPESLLVYIGVGVCSLNILIYVRRFWIRRSTATLRHI